MRNNFLPFSCGARNTIYLQRSSKSMPTTEVLDKKEDEFIAGACGLEISSVCVGWVTAAGTGSVGQRMLTHTSHVPPRALSVAPHQPRHHPQMCTRCCVRATTRS
jgi:hypothetical protein